MKGSHAAFLDISTACGFFGDSLFRLQKATNQSYPGPSFLKGVVNLFILTNCVINFSMVWRLEAILFSYFSCTAVGLPLVSLTTPHLSLTLATIAVRGILYFRDA